MSSIVPYNETSIKIYRPDGRVLTKEIIDIKRFNVLPLFKVSSNLDIVGFIEKNRILMNEKDELNSELDKYKRYAELYYKTVDSYNKLVRENAELKRIIQKAGISQKTLI